MELVSAKTNIDFMGKGKYAMVLSLLCVAASIYVWVSTGSAKFGIDYLGGHELVVQIDSEDAGSEKIRKALKDKGLENAVVQSFDEMSTNEFAIRLPGSLPSDDEETKKAKEQKDEATRVQEKVVAALGSVFPGKFEILGTDFVGPTIGQELKRKALIAIIVSLIGILGYITYRFEFAFALGAVAALFHDVIICLGVYLVSGRSLSMAALAAALTIVGYSVNDTIIVFDRMREEIFARKEYELVPLMNYSINATLSRTIITSLLTLFSALALLIFGGGAIADLSLFLVVGVITGTYSTIFIASPVALAWENFRSRGESE